MITIAETHGACVRSPTVASCFGATPSNDQANRFRVQIIPITSRRSACQRMKLSPIRTFRNVLSVMIPAKKFNTGETGIPEPSSVFPSR